MPGNCGEARAGAKTAGFKAEFKKSCQDGAANRFWEELAMPRLAAAFAAIAVLLGGLTPARAAIVVTVDKSAQRLAVTVDGAQRYEWPVSTARIGYRTPNGTYKPQRLARKWFSRKYDWSPMPYSIFFDGGYAIHGS
jgi:lipoprotein-anchoring transpeptidase ErfK/SrfK